MGRSRRGAVYLLLITALLAGYILNLKQTGFEDTEDFPAVEWIRAQEEADVGDVERLLLLREQAEAQALQEEEKHTEEKPMDKQSLRRRLGSSVIVVEKSGTGGGGFGIRYLNGASSI